MHFILIFKKILKLITIDEMIDGFCKSLAEKLHLTPD